MKHTVYHVKEKLIHMLHAVLPGGVIRVMFQHKFGELQRSSHLVLFFRHNLAEIKCLEIIKTDSEMTLLKLNTVGFPQ